VRIAAVLPVLLALPLLTACEPGCDIIVAGTFERVDNPRLKASLDSTEGLFPNLAPYRFADETEDIVARIGTGFGFQYALSGFMERKDVTATLWHPAVRDEKSGLSTSMTVPWNPNRDSITWWFEREAELVPGDWTLRIEHLGRAVCEKTFRVTKPYV